MLATVAGIAVRDGLITNLDAPVGATVKDGGYDSPRNAQVTWKHHLQQTSEWEGNMWGKQDNFIGKEAFGEGEMKPREQKKPGTHYEYNDVRINRFALSLLRTFNKPVPDVFREQVMDPIGASNTWRWIPYHNSCVELNGRKVASVSGGTRWGGGMWINSYDMARFGYLWLRGGKWGDKQILPPAFVKEALTPGRRAQLSRQRLRLPVVAQHDRQGTGGAADQRVFGERRRQQHHHGVARPRPRRGVALAPGQRRGVRQARRRGDQAGHDVRSRQVGIKADPVELMLPTLQLRCRLSHLPPPSDAGYAARMSLSNATSAARARPARRAR